MATHAEHIPLPLLVSSNPEHPEHTPPPPPPPPSLTSTSPRPPSPLPVALAFPDGGSRAWLVILGSSCLLTSTFGLSCSAGIFQSQLSLTLLSAYTPSTVGWIPSLNIFLCLFLGVQVGPLFDAYGPFYLVLTGSVLNVVSLFLTAQCTLYWQFMLAYGVLNGVAGALLSTTAVSVVAHWFEVHRGKASGLAFVGSSVGGVAFPLMLGPLFERLGWAGAVRVLAAVVAVLVGVGCVCVKGRLPGRRSGGAVDLRCFRDMRFVWATVGISCFEFVLFGALGLLPTYALSLGFSTQTAFNVIAILNAGSALGRYAAGVLADRIGRFNTTCLILLLTTIVTFALWLPLGATTEVKGNPNTQSTILFYVFSPLFGFGSGSIISLAPVCFGQLCRAGQYGRFYGTGYSIVSFGTLLCIPIGGSLLPAAGRGAEAFVAFFGGMLVVSLGSFGMARWACLEYSWKWRTKI